MSQESTVSVTAEPQHKNTMICESHISQQHTTTMNVSPVTHSGNMQKKTLTHVQYK